MSGMIKRLTYAADNMAPHDDLYGTGVYGILVALSKYDPNAGAKFTTYATFYIRKYVFKERQRITTLIKYPEGHHDRKSLVERAHKESIAKFGFVKREWVEKRTKINWNRCLELKEFERLEVVSKDYSPLTPRANSFDCSPVCLQSNNAKFEKDFDKVNVVQMSMLDDLPEEYLAVLQDMENGLTVSDIATKYNLTYRRAKALVEGIKEIESER